MHFDPDHESPKDRRARIEAEIRSRREAGEPFLPLEVASRRGYPATTWWGRSWCENLEAYSDYASRLPAGRTCLRGGHVHDLEIAPGSIFAYVTGAEIFEVLIHVAPLSRATWDALRSRLAGEVTHLADLLAGRFGPGVMEGLAAREDGIFPRPDEITLTCSCPDWAHLCPHAAAVLYGVGVRFDREPELFFGLRQVDGRELVEAATGEARHATALRNGDDSSPLPRSADLSEIFGIEISDPDTAFPD